jgi:hypothetical protein
MMKVKCVSTEDGDISVTVGKVYVVEEYDPTSYLMFRIVDDNGNLQWEHKDNFALIPDEPAPKSELLQIAPEWIKMDWNRYLSMVSGLILTFWHADSGNYLTVQHISETGEVAPYCVYGEYADAFANLPGVNHQWSESAR